MTLFPSEKPILSVDLESIWNGC